MRTKEDIVSNWLPRYTGLPLEAFKPFVLLTNFDNYLDIYLPGDDRSQCIFYTDRDAAIDCPVPWLPAFQPTKCGSIDIWKNGHWHASYVWTHEGMRKAGTDPS